MIATGTIFVVLAVLGWLLAHRIAEQEAREGATAKAAVTARVGFAPFLVDGALDRDPEALVAIDLAGRRLIDESQALHIKIWSIEGQVLWADTPVAGATFDLDPSEVRLFGTDGFTYAVGRFDGPEHEFDGQAGERVLEVFLGARTSPSGTPVLVESYYPYSIVDDRASELRGSFLPILLGGLALLAGAQIPLTVALARRLRRYQQERERLLGDVIEAAGHERRRLAAEVHDGALQDLIGVSFELSGAAANAQDGEREKLDEIGVEMRRAIRKLRSILNSLYPVAALTDGWVSGLSGIVDAMRSQGVNVDVEVPDFDLSPREQDVLLRTAREALRNAASHSLCTSVVVRLLRESDHLLLVIRDDGQGFSPAVAMSQRRAGHLGLQLISDLASEVGGVLSVESEVGHGTEVRLELFDRVREHA